jgi:uncharacterized BrkB/YihY/UPF0761 family membrane protein
MAIFVELLVFAWLSVWIVILCTRCVFVLQSLRGLGGQRQAAATNDSNTENEFEPTS